MTGIFELNLSTTHPHWRLFHCRSVDNAVAEIHSCVIEHNMKCSSKEMLVINFLRTPNFLIILDLQLGSHDVEQVRTYNKLGAIMSAALAISQCKGSGPCLSAKTPIRGGPNPRIPFSAMNWISFHVGFFQTDQALETFQSAILSAVVFSFHVSVEANPIVPPIVQMFPKKIAKFVSIVLLCTKPQLLLHIKAVLNGRRSSEITKGGSGEWEGVILNIKNFFFLFYWNSRLT